MIVIIGAGVMGASAAYHLATLGRRDVRILERGGAPGKGSTGLATGGFRAQFETGINVRLSLLAREKLRRFESDTGLSSGYSPAGYLWLASSGREMTALREAREVQHAAGLTESIELTPAEIASRNPAVRLDGVIGGAFCPTDGFLRAGKIVQGYLAVAERHGIRVESGVEVTGLDRGAHGRINAVRTSAETIRLDGDTDAVVNAAGPWAASIASMAGVELPVAPLRRQVAVTVPTDALPEDMPMTIFLGDGFHLRVRDRRVLLLRPTPGVPGQPFDTRVEREWVEGVVSLARSRVPALEGVEIDRDACYAGLYEMSPDKHAILGPAPGCANLYLINGSSGHGVMHAPALGQLLAEMIVHGAARTLDVTALRPARFLEGRPNPSSDLL